MLSAYLIVVASYNRGCTSTLSSIRCHQLEQISHYSTMQPQSTKPYLAEEVAISQSLVTHRSYAKWCTFNTKLYYNCAIRVTCSYRQKIEFLAHAVCMYAYLTHQKSIRFYSKQSILHHFQSHSKYKCKLGSRNPTCMHAMVYIQWSGLWCHAITYHNRTVRQCKLVIFPVDIAHSNPIHLPASQTIADTFRLGTSIPLHVHVSLYQNYNNTQL